MQADIARASQVNSGGGNGSSRGGTNKPRPVQGQGMPVVAHKPFGDEVRVCACVRVFTLRAVSRLLVDFSYRPVLSLDARFLTLAAATTATTATSTTTTATGAAADATTPFVPPQCLLPVVEAQHVGAPAHPETLWAGLQGTSAVVRRLPAVVVCAVCSARCSRCALAVVARCALALLLLLPVVADVRAFCFCVCLQAFPQLSTLKEHCRDYDP
jgi:hypothetical protein